MQWPGWFVLAVLFAGLVLMACFDGVVAPDLTMLGMLVVLLAVGESVLPLELGLEGFGNSGLLTVTVLFVLAAGISQTGGLEYAFSAALGTPSTTRAALARLVTLVTLCSAFLNNTPVVAILLPVLASWSRRAGIAPGHVYMPLSAASILGGSLTLLGSSTNLVVVGKHREMFPRERAIGIFDLSLYAVPIALSGAVYIILFAPRLLPGKVKATKVEGEGWDDAFLVGLRVLPDSQTIGRTLAHAGLRGLDGAYLTTVKRGATVIHAVGPDFVICAGDVLYFAGDLGRITDLGDRLDLSVVAHAFELDLPAIMGSPFLQHVTVDAGPPGGTADDGGDEGGTSLGSRSYSTNTETALLSSPRGGGSQLGGFSMAQHSPPMAALTFAPGRLLQATVRADARDILHVSVRDAQFRTEFGAAIVSIRRRGQRLHGRFGDVVLQAADELLCDAGPHFDEDSDVVTANLQDVQAVVEGGEREFMSAFRVQGPAGDGGVLPTPGCLVGRSVQGAGLRGLPGLFLAAIERGADTLHAVPPTETLREGDVLWFAGSTQGVIALRKMPGLRHLDEQADKLLTRPLDRRLVQVVLNRGSDLCGKTVRQTRFRSKFDAAIVALHRQGQRLRRRIGDIYLAAGDVLLLDTGPHFLPKHLGDRNFALVTEVADSHPPRYSRAVVACGLAAAAIVVAAAGLLSLFTAAAIACAGMLMTGCLSADVARASVKWDVVVTIAAAFGISNAMEHTGAAAAVADLLIKVGAAFGGNAALQIAIYVGASLVSNVVANNAAAALTFPIAAEVAVRQGLRVDLVSYLVIFGASATFAVPFSYQTNLMVYGAGGYRFRDFMRFGGPLQIWLGVTTVTVVLLPHLWPLWWALSGLAALATFMWPAAREALASWRARNNRDDSRYL